MQFREIHNMSFFLFYLTKTKKTTRFFLSPDITITDKRYRGPSPEKTPEISAERNATKDSRGGGGGERSLSPLTKSLVCMSVCALLLPSTQAAALLSGCNGNYVTIPAFITVKLL
jgi:hypothetical protein